MKYKKIKSFPQYNEYCSLHEQLLVKNDKKYQDEIELLEVLIEEFDNIMLKNKYEQLNPVELLRNLLLEAGLNQNEFSKKMGTRE
ncbi:MAG: hypothetical protein AAGG75_19360 [Bacteroidota bacterium]